MTPSADLTLFSALVQFERSLVAKGRDGGREAALALARHITALADKELGRSVQIVVSCFYNKSGLSKILQVRPALDGSGKGRGAD